MSRFTESQGEVIIDNETGLFWHKKDSRQLTGKWLHLEKARKFAEEQNKAGFGGYDDWRIPTLDEVKTIYARNSATGTLVIMKSLFPIRLRRVVPTAHGPTPSMVNAR